MLREVLGRAACIHSFYFQIQGIFYNMLPKSYFWYFLSIFFTDLSRAGLYTVSSVSSCIQFASGHLPDKTLQPHRVNQELHKFKIK